MTVNNRKLFANRDARRRLAEMGGIMASSADLLGEAQKFQDGGRVIPGDMPPIPQQAPMSPTIGQQIGGQLRDFFQPIGDSMRETMQPVGQSMRETMQPIGSAIREGLASSYEVGPLEAMMAAGGENIPPVAPTNRLSREDLMTQTQPVTIDYLGNPVTVYVSEDGNIFDASGQNMMLTTPRGDFEAIANKVNQTLQLEGAAAAAAREREAGAARATFERTGSGEDLAAATQAEAAAADIPEARVVRPDPIELARLRGASAEGRDVFAEEGPGATGLSGQVAPAPAAAEEPESSFSPIEAAATDPNTPPAERNTNAANQFLKELGLENPENLSAAERVKAYEAMFKEMLGEGDEDTQKQMWHNMAMIGFAIAAGESPRALQNIANGLLEGTKMMKQDRATRQEREDRIKMLAISEGLQDERAAAKTASAERIAALRARDGGRDPRNPIDFWQNTYNTALTAASEGAAYDLSEGETPEQYAQRKADAALTANRERFTGYASNATLSNQPSDAPAQTPAGGIDTEGHKRANDTAKAAGQATYIGPDGKEYKVQ
jgi:hypothetical protein